MLNSPMDSQEKQYAALAPILAIAGIFVHPTASVLLPLGLFFIFHFLHKDNAGLVALRSADLAFSIQLCLILASLLLMLLMSAITFTQQEAQSVMSAITLVLLIYMGLSLCTAALQVFRGRVMRHWFSFRIGERVLNAVNRGKRQGR